MSLINIISITQIQPNALIFILIIAIFQPFSAFRVSVDPGNQIHELAL